MLMATFGSAQSILEDWNAPLWISEGCHFSCHFCSISYFVKTYLYLLKTAMPMIPQTKLVVAFWDYSSFKTNYICGVEAALVTTFLGSFTNLSSVYSAAFDRKCLLKEIWCHIHNSQHLLLTCLKPDRKEQRKIDEAKKIRQWEHEKILKRRRNRVQRTG